MIIKETYPVAAGDMTVAGDVSASIKRQMKRIGIPSQIMRRVAVCTYEAEINLVIHSDGGEIGFEISEEDIRVRVKDVGPGIPDIDRAMTEGFSTASDNIRSLGFGAGMGLPNMKRYSDYMDIKSTVGVGTTITMRVNIN